MLICCKIIECPEKQKKEYYRLKSRFLFHGDFNSNYLYHYNILQTSQQQQFSFNILQTMKRKTEGSVEACDPACEISKFIESKV